MGDCQHFITILRANFKADVLNVYTYSLSSERSCPRRSQPSAGPAAPQKAHDQKGTPPPVWGLRSPLSSPSRGLGLIPYAPKIFHGQLWPI